MFVTSAEYKKVVTSIAEEEGELLVAVAFWGKVLNRLSIHGLADLSK